MSFYRIQQDYQINPVCDICLNFNFTKSWIHTIIYLSSAFVCYRIYTSIRLCMYYVAKAGRASLIVMLFYLRLIPSQYNVVARSSVISENLHYSLTPSQCVSEILCCCKRIKNNLTHLFTQSNIGTIMTKVLKITTVLCSNTHFSNRH